MYGTVGRFIVKPGHADAVAQEVTRWQRERAPRVPGYIGQYALRADDRPDEWLVFVIFESSETYRQNAVDPEQHAAYERLRSHLAADPEWTDGEITAVESVTVPL